MLGKTTLQIAKEKVFLYVSKEIRGRAVREAFRVQSLCEAFGGENC